MEPLPPPTSGLHGKTAFTLGLVENLHLDHLQLDSRQSCCSHRILLPSHMSGQSPGVLTAPLLYPLGVALTPRASHCAFSVAPSKLFLNSVPESLGASGGNPYTGMAGLNMPLPSPEASLWDQVLTALCASTKPLTPGQVPVAFFSVELKRVHKSGTMPRLWAW